MERRERDLERELRSHLELETEEQGGDRSAAQRALGNTALIQEEVRDMWRWTRLREAMRDVQYAFRAMRKNPGFTSVALLSLTLGIGATTSVFSVMNAFVLRPLPVAEPERLVSVLRPLVRGKRSALFNPVFEHLRGEQQSLTGMFAASDDEFLKARLEGGAPSFVAGSIVSGNYFDVLGLQPALGRLLNASDDDPAATCVAVVSHRFWASRLGADPGALGRTITVREKACAIVGVTPPAFRGHQHGFPLDVWLPMRQMTDPKLLASRTMAFYSGAMGRLRPGVTLREAESELTGLYQRFHSGQTLRSPFPGDAAPTAADFAMKLAPGAQGLEGLRGHYQQPLFLALAVACVVLLIAAVNVANLLLARGAARHAELSTRAALGASRPRLMRQLTIEGATLAVCGGLTGIALAWAATPALGSLISRQLDTPPDWRVLSAALAATLLTAALSGVAPALRLSRVGVHAGERAVGSRSGQRLTRVLVATQLALSLLLITSAGLLLRSMLRILSIDPGFKTSNVVMMNVSDTEPGARNERMAALYRDLDRRLNAIPGVQAASLSWLGLFGGNYVGVNLYDVERPQDSRFTLTDYVSPGYFEAIGMQLDRGRGFEEVDREGAQRVAVVNQAFVRDRFPGGEEAIGRSFVMTYGTDKRPFTIVGILRDAKYNDLREKKTDPMMWVPLSQAPQKITSVTLRVQPGVEGNAIRDAEAALKATSPHLMVRKTTTLAAQVDQATARERLLLKTASTFGGLALLLAAVGLYGTLAYAVTRRTREIGVRLALGAQRRSVIGMVLGESLTLVVGGLLAGIPLSLAAGYLLRTFLFGIEPFDVPALVGATVLLTAVALIAALVPARRASRVDPVIALKYE